MTNITNYFDYIISGDEVTNSKPDPEIFLQVCKKLNIPPENALVLEDSQNGILAAVNANIPVICIPDLVNHPSDINDLTYQVLPSLKDVVNILKTENNVDND